MIKNHSYCKNKKYLFFLLALLVQLSPLSLHAQREDPEYMVRAYEDEDYLNDFGEGTDRAYSSGLQVNVFYNLSKPRFFLDRWLPKAGDSSINTYGLGVMQLMYTPDSIDNSYYIPDDYSYAGGLIGKHSLYSFNPQKKYDLQTELVFGVMGPAAFGKPLQRWLHKEIHDREIPNGWDNQYKNAALVNINFTAEKELIQSPGVEAIGSGQICAGTMLDEVEAGTTVYIGRMRPYFNGFMSHYSTLYAEKERGRKKVQFYFMIRAAVQGILYNAMLQGGLFTPLPMVKTLVYSGATPEVKYIEMPKQEIENIAGYATYGPVLAYRHFSISYTQIYSSPVLFNVYSHIWGNVSIYYSW